MHVLHTAGVPPSSGRIILPTIGCIANNSVAPTKSVTAYSRRTAVRSGSPSGRPRAAADSIAASGPTSHGRIDRQDCSSRLIWSGAGTGEPPGAVLTAGHVGLALPRERRCPDADAAQAPRDLTGGVDPGRPVHHPHFVEANARADRVVEREHRQELLVDRGLVDGAVAILLGDVRE